MARPLHEGTFTSPLTQLPHDDENINTNTEDEEEDLNGKRRLNLPLNRSLKAAVALGLTDGGVDDPEVVTGPENVDGPESDGGYNHVGRPGSTDGMPMLTAQVPTEGMAFLTALDPMALDRLSIPGSARDGLNLCPNYHIGARIGLMATGSETSETRISTSRTTRKETLSRPTTARSPPNENGCCAPTSSPNRIRLSTIPSNMSRI